jgi:hypothetical protein
MYETEVDGVPVLWADAPGPLTGALTFGVGARDETFRTIGITHLVEHLVMSTLPRVHYEHNAGVGLDVTEFYATGNPEHVVDFLTTVCRALADLPLHRVAKEAGVLAAEGGHVTHTTAAVLLNRRFGANGPGLAYWKGPGFDQLTARHVTEHVRAYFTRSNAVLTLTGPPPDGLRLPLPDGVRPARVPPPIVSGPAASWAAEATPGPGLALLGPTRDARFYAATSVLRERLIATARHELGISYDVATARCDVDGRLVDRAIWLDARDGQEAKAATILWQTATGIAADGLSAEELAFVTEGVRHLVADPRAVTIELTHATYTRLLGLHYLPGTELVAELAGVTPAEVAASLAESLRTALLTVPEHVELDVGLPRGGCPRLASVPQGQVFRPYRYMRLLNKGSRVWRLVLGASGVTFVDGDGDIHHVEFADVVGLRADEDGRVVFGRGGCVIPVSRSLFGNVYPVIDALDRAVPVDLHYRPSAFATND